MKVQKSEQAGATRDGLLHQNPNNDSAKQLGKSTAASARSNTPAVQRGLLAASIFSAPARVLFGSGKKILCLLIAAQFTASVNAAPLGGEVVGGTGTILQQGAQTTIEQSSNRLAIDWDSFNVSLNEKVTFNQPGADALALNRILSEDPSRIFGQIEANGRIILANPNGVLFGSDAQLDVGSLVASGLAIDAAEFMAGELRFSGQEGTVGQVVNQGLIAASTGGNVALLGKSVINTGLIRAQLGRVALAAGDEAVVTFDDAGLLGVAINAATLEGDLAGAYSITNLGRIDAAGGQIMLSASVSEDLFSQAVNRGDFRDATQAIVHDDGTFTLGEGGGVYNNGTLNASSEDGDAGEVWLVGETVVNNGTIEANAPNGAAGNVQLQAGDQLRLSSAGLIEAKGDRPSGRVALKGNGVHAGPGAKIDTSGYAVLAATGLMRTPETQAEHMLLTALAGVSQAGAMTLAGNLHLATLADANLNLTHTDNDFGSLSVAAQYVSNIRLSNSSDLTLGDITLYDSTLRVNLTGDDTSVRQAQDSELGVYDSLLELRAPNIYLGEQGAQVSAVNSSINLRFEQAIATNGAIDFGDDGNFSSLSVIGSQDGLELLRLTGRQSLADINARILDDMSIEIDSMLGQTAKLQTFSDITQSGPIKLSGNLDLSSPSFAAFVLDHAENELNSLSVAFGHSNSLKLNVANDVILRNLLLEGASANISAGGTVRQAANTNITGAEGGLDITANSIILGGAGTSSIDFLGTGALFLDFNDRLVLNGPISLGTYGSYLRITGSDANNTFMVGEHASFASNEPTFFEHIIDLGAGDDQVIYNQSFDIPLYLGAGADVMTIDNPNIQYDLQDLNPEEDALLVRNP